MRLLLVVEITLRELARFADGKFYVRKQAPRVSFAVAYRAPNTGS
jgi:hypothetical protein